MTTVKRYALEIRYGALGVVLIGGLVVLDQLDVLSGVSETLARWMDDLASIGVVGVFVIALIANASILIQIPYTLPLLSAALAGASLSRLLILGLAAGLGAGFGEIVSYKVADVLIARNPDLARSAMFQWIARNVERHPARTWAAIFVVAASPLPDDAVVVPLATVKYGIRRIAAPLFVGKVVHNITVAIVFSTFAGWSAAHVTRTTSADLALVVVILFVLIIMYQAEKARSLATTAASCATEPA